MADKEDIEEFLDDPEKIEEEAEEAMDLDSDEAQIQMIIEERDEYKDRYLRALAETENIRRRTAKERKDAETYGGQKLARDILAIYDNISRAFDAIDDKLREDNPNLVTGLELTQRELVNIFEKHKIFIISPEVGDKFDPNLHQAMFEAPVPNHEAGTLIQVMAVGFQIGDRLLRAAQVGVASKAE